MFSPSPLAFLFFLTVLSGTTRAQSVKLNSEFPVLPVGNVLDYAFTTDGSTLVYGTDDQVQGIARLYAVVADGTSTPIPLTGGHDVLDFWLSPEDSFLVFSSGQPTTFYVAPLDGSGPYPVVSGIDTSFEARITPDGQWFVGFAATSYPDGIFYSVRTDGSAPPAALTPEVFIIPQFGMLGVQYELTDSGYIVYRAAEFSDGEEDLFSVPVDGSAPPSKLNLPFPTLGTDLVEFQVHPNGTHIVYQAQQNSNGGFDLFIVPADGSTPPVQINEELAQFDIDDFGLSDDGSHVAYSFRDGSMAECFIECYKLYFAPVAGGAPTRLGASYAAYSPIRDIRVSPDEQNVAFKVDSKLHSTRSDGSSGVHDLNPGFNPCCGILYLTATDTRAVWVSGGGFGTLFSAPLDGSATQELALTGPDERLEDFQVAPGGVRIAYRVESNADNRVRLYSVPTDGSQPRTLLNAPALPLGDVSSFVFLPNDSCGYRTTQDLGSIPGTGVLSVPLDGGTSPLLLTPSPSDQVIVGDVTKFAATLDGQRAVYVANQEHTNAFELFSAPIRGGERPLDLDGFNGFGAVAGFILTVQGEVVYLADQLTENRRELFLADPAVPNSRVRLNAPLQLFRSVRAYAVTPNGNHAVYLAAHASDGNQHLHSVETSPGASPIRIDLGPEPHSFIDLYRLSNDSNRVVYDAQGFSENGDGLWSTPIGGGGAVRLNDPPFLGAVFDFQITPDSARVVYVSTEPGSQVLQLYSVLIDASGPPTLLHAPLGAAQDVYTFLISPTSSHVVYVADQDVDAVREIYSVPVDGGAAPTKLNSPLVPGGDVEPGLGELVTYGVSPSGEYVVYVADQDTDGLRELYSVPIDASAPPVKLSPTPAPFSVPNTPHTFEFTSDSQHLVFIARAPGASFSELFAAPLDGGHPATKINGSVAAAITKFAIAPNNLEILYVGEQTAGVEELFQTSLDVSFPPTKISDTIVGNEPDLFFSFVPDSRRVLYLTEQDTEDVYELYSTKLRGSPRRGGRPTTIVEVEY